MPDYDEHLEVVDLLKTAQDVDEDLRDMARQCHLFVSSPSGQWEQGIYNDNDGKPRYQFDMTSQIVDLIAGEIERADFSIQIDPSSNAATEKNAETMQSLVQAIEQASDAESIYNHAARNMVTAGIDGWEIQQNYVDEDTFAQDLSIVPVHNWVDRVYFDHASEARCGGDARFAFKLSGITPEEFEERYDRPGVSLSENQVFRAYADQKKVVNVGEFFYYKEVEVRLFLFDNDQVVTDEMEQYKELMQGMEDAGISKVDERVRTKKVVCVRKFDGKDWLDESQETVFDQIPLIPLYANYKIYDNKLLYHGIVEKLMDQQRVLNYSVSREIEESALAPRQKYLMTTEQAAGHEAELQELNVSIAPVMFYNHIDGQPQPFQTGGSQVNQGLRLLSENMRQMMGQSAGMFAASQGDNPGLQSGTAIQKLQDKSDTGTIKYFNAQEVAIRKTAQILVASIPKIYSEERMIRVIGTDSQRTMININERQQDGSINNEVVDSRYEVVCSAGPAFKNRQDETVQSIVQIGQVDPSFIQLGGDILANNITAPGMDQLARRKREQLFKAGAIPPTDFTEQEQQQAAAAQQAPKEPDPMSVAAEAELIKAKNEETKTNISVQEKSANIQISQGRLQLDAEKFNHERQMDMAKAEKTIAETDGQKIENMISLDQMKNMSNEQLLRLANDPRI
jgi:hypothetical protein